MLARRQNKSGTKTYADCTVDAGWHMASKFRDWYHKQPGCNDSTRHLESDIAAFLTGTRKCYSPETSFFCSRSLNIKFGHFQAALKSLSDPSEKLPTSIFQSSNGTFVLKLRNSHIASFSTLEDAKRAALYYRTQQMLEDIISDVTVPDKLKVLASKKLLNLE